MTQIHIRAELTPSEFPYNFRELGTTTIVGGSTDIPRSSPGSFGGSEKVQNYGICQPYLLQNVMPISSGYSTVGFTQKIESNPEIGDIQAAFPILGDSGALAMFVADVDRAYVFDPNGDSWTDLEFPAAVNGDITYATIRDTTYIHFGSGLFTYDFSTKSFVEVQLNGIAGVGDTYGCCAAGGRLILWSNNTIFRSSVLDATDFEPSLSSGAGSNQIQQLKGIIVTCLSLGDGFVIYTNLHAMAARFTGNTQTPFRYTEISGSSGVYTSRHVAHNSNTGIHIAWTQQGIQFLNANEASPNWANLSDGIIRGYFMQRNEFFGFPEIAQTEGFDVSLTYATNRYFCISLRKIVSEETHRDIAYIYDSVLQRWGVLEIPHVTFLEYLVPESYNIYTYDDLNADYTNYGELEATGKTYRGLVPPTSLNIPDPGTTLGIILPDGSLYSVAWHETSEFRGTDGSEIGAKTPAVILGKYKAAHGVGLEIHKMTAKTLSEGSLTVYGHEYNGDIVAIKDDFVSSGDYLDTFYGRLPVDSFSIQFSGKFKLTDLQITAAPIGGVNLRKLYITKLLSMTTNSLVEGYKTSRPYAPTPEENVEHTAGILNSFGFLTYDNNWIVSGASIENTIDLYTPLQEHYVYDIDSTESTATLLDNITIYNPLIQYTHPPEDFIEVAANIESTISVVPVLIVHTVYDIESFEYAAAINDVITLETI